MHTVFVTGGTGFIGSHTIEHLIALGHRVRCLIRPGRKDTGWLTGLPVECVTADIFSPDQISRVLQGCDTVIHLAGVTKARRSSDYFRSNVEATRVLLEATRKAGGFERFCHISSLAAVGPSPVGATVDEHHPCRPLTAYGRSKLEAERVVHSYQDRVPTVIVRPPAVYGPRDRDIFELFRYANYGIRPRIGSGDRNLSMVFGPDLARGIAAVTFSPQTAGETYFISDPTPYRFGAMMDILAGLIGKRSVTIPVPAPLLFAIAAVVEAVSFFGPVPAVLSIDKARDLVQTSWTCSAEKVRKDIGFATSTPIGQGLEQTYRWYRDQGWL